jgi:hypothetical protein
MERLEGAKLMGESITRNISFEAYIHPIDNLSGAEDYWTRYADVASDPGYGRMAGPQGAWRHYTERGIGEGRTWVVDTKLLPYAGCPVNGANFIRFATEARILGINWQSTVKVGNSEVLIILVAGPTGEALMEPGYKSILPTHHHAPGAACPPIVRDVHFSENYPLILPAGYVLWVYAEGWGDARQGGLECQIGVTVLNDSAA